MSVDVEIIVPNEVIKGSFLTAIQEVEALNEFYNDFITNWNQNKIELENTYKIGLAINDVLQNIPDDEDNVESLKAQIDEKDIFGTELKEIINVTLTRENDKNNISYSMSSDFQSQDPQLTRNKKYKLDSQRTIFCRSVLSNVIIIFEKYLAQIYEFLVVSNPEQYFEGKTIKTSRLFSATVEEIIISEVREEVSNNLFDSIKTLDKMNEKSSINLDRYICIRKVFEEIYYRRNLFVHNEGVVNKIYLDNIHEEYKKGVKCGDKLVCDDYYLHNSIVVLKEMICVLFYEFLVSIKSDAKNYDILSQNIAFSALNNEEYAFCEYIYGILVKNKEFSFLDKSMFEVNRMIALKQQGKSIRKWLDGFDVSAMQTQFAIAKCCLQDDFDSVYTLLSRTYPESFNATAIRDWPIFIDFRKTEQYEKFKLEHSDDFKQYLFDSDETIDNSENLNISENESKLVEECV
ncbi:MAG: hypothetical protein IJX38_04875 [Clostridia bacterium]|nr:hypothetical protein [Clostridia bacterium]